MTILKPVRARLKAGMGRRRGATPKVLQALDLAAMHRAVIVRPNTRIGNILFLLPLLDALADASKGRWVDLIVGNGPIAEQLLKTHAAVGSITAVPSVGRARPAELAAAYRTIRAKDLDLVIDPTSNSTSSRVLVALSRSRHRLGFAGNDQWVRLTHAVPLPAGKIPAWRLPLELLQVFGPSVEPGRFHDMVLTMTRLELTEGAHRLQHAMERQSGNKVGRRVVGFFCDARGDKKLSLDWWRSWAKELTRRCDLSLVQILPGPDAPRISDKVPGIFSPGLRMLGATVSGLNLFVSCDTGPMHLAAAVSTPVSALFSHTDAGVFGPQTARDQIVQVRDTSVPDVVSQQLAHLAALA